MGILADQLLPERLAIYHPVKDLHYNHDYRITAADRLTFAVTIKLVFYFKLLHSQKALSANGDQRTQNLYISITSASHVDIFVNIIRLKHNFVEKIPITGQTPFFNLL